MFGLNLLFVHSTIIKYYVS